MTDMGGTLYREPSMEEIVEKLKAAKSDGRLYNFRLNDTDKLGRAAGQVMGFLRRYREGKPIRSGTEWLMRNIEAGINSGVELIDWDETLEMWNAARPVEYRNDDYADFQ